MSFFLLVLESLPEKRFDTDVPVWCRVNNKHFFRQTPNDLLYICCSISRTVCAVLYADLCSKMGHLCFRVQKMWSSDLVSAQKKEKLWSNKPHVFFFFPETPPDGVLINPLNCDRSLKIEYLIFSPSLLPPKRLKNDFKKWQIDCWASVCSLFCLGILLNYHETLFKH